MPQIGFIRAAVSSDFKILCIKFSSFMSRFGCSPVTGLRFCAHTGRFKDGTAVAVLGWDCAVFLDFAGAFGNIYQAVL